MPNEDLPLRPSSMLELPQTLREAIAAALAEVPSQRWLRAAQELSERYRAERRGGEAALARGVDQALGYAALIMPATYAQVRGALAAIAARMPAWQPQRVLDLGSGPGTALWAVADQWPAAAMFAAYEREASLIALGQRLTRQASHALQTIHWEQRDLSQWRPAEAAAGRHEDGPFDLVIIAHVLNELEQGQRQRLIDLAWARTSGMLLVIEPGTSQAFPIIQAARNQLLAAGARTVAPCPHDHPCPLSADFCHFPQRLSRPEFQKRARGAPSAWEDAKYSYAAMARMAPLHPSAARVIREPTFNKAYAEAIICQPSGVGPYRALKRHKAAFRTVKDLVWGQEFNPDAHDL